MNEGRKEKLNVMLVEDNPGDARLLKELVKDFTFLDVNLIHTLTLKDSFEKGEEAALILLDLSLPDSSGMETITRMKSHFPDTPVIILTGLNDSEIAQQAVGKGAQDYLLKGKTDVLMLEKTITYAIERNKYYKQQLEVEAAKRENIKLAKINQQLSQLLHELEKSNKRLEEFAYVSTHNLRAPIVNLKSLVQLFRQVVPNLEGKPLTIFEKVETTINSLNSTLQDLIGIVAITKTAVSTKQKAEFSALTEKIKGTIESQIQQSGASIETDFSMAPSIIYPRDHLESIFLNLFTNSIKYRSGSPPLIEVRSYSLDDSICLEFKDNGIGIDLERDRDKIFRMFQKLNYGSEGKGLGLFIVKSQVESLGGSIHVESHPGKGTTFRIVLKNDPETSK